MNLLYKLLGVEKIQKKGFSFPSYSIGGSANFLNWTKNSDAYSTNDTVYSIIKTLGRKAASVPIEVYANDTEIEENELTKLLKRPNPSIGGDAFFEGVFSWYALKGEAIIWLNRGGIENGKVLEMYLLPPDNMTAVADDQDLYGIKAWIFEANGKKIVIPKEDILHWKTFNPSFDAYEGSHLRGFNPLRSAAKRLQQDNDGMDAAVAMFQNGGAKGVLFNRDFANLTAEQQSQLKGVIDRKVNNAEMKAAVATLQGEWGYLDLGLTGVDMQLLASQELSMKRLCAVFGVPYELFQSDTTFANKEMAMKSFLVNTIIPYCKSFADELNRIVVPAFGRFKIEFDFSSVHELQTDQAKMSTIYNAMFDRGALTINEYRELMGFDETTDPAHNKFYITGTYVPMSDLQLPDENNLDEEDGL